MTVQPYTMYGPTPTSTVFEVWSYFGAPSHRKSVLYGAFGTKEEAISFIQERPLADLSVVESRRQHQPAPKIQYITCWTNSREVGPSQSFLAEEARVALCRAETASFLADQKRRFEEGLLIDAMGPKPMCKKRKR